MSSIMMVYAQIDHERRKEPRRLPMNTVAGQKIAASLKEGAANSIQAGMQESSLTWFDVLHASLCEAFAEQDQDKQRDRLVNLAANAVQAIETIDRRG